MYTDDGEWIIPPAALQFAGWESLGPPTWFAADQSRTPAERVPLDVAPWGCGGTCSVPNGWCQSESAVKKIVAMTRHRTGV